MANDNDKNEQKSLQAWDNLMRSYAAKDGARARSARMNSREAMASYEARAQRRASRAGRPLTSQESHEQALKSQAAYESARQARAHASEINAYGRTTNRDLIDGRGSIDSRALHERNELVGYSIDKGDTHDPLIETEGSVSRWRSRDNASTPKHASPPRERLQNLDNISDALSGSREYGKAANKKPGIPGIIKFLAILIIVLVIALIVILFL